MMTGRGVSDGDAAGGLARHIPVLSAEVLEALRPTDGEIHVDGTFGAGGYSRMILEAADCRVLAIDRDPEAIAAGAAMVAAFGGRLRLVQGRFSQMDDLAAGHGIGQVDGVVLDLGVSSMQLDEAERGFSFMRDGPLDMRMSRTGASAADFVNHADEAVIADVLWALGDERKSRRIARAIVRRRAEQPFERTADLAEAVARAVGPSRERINPATRTFQALRIHVNGELREVARGLAAAERLLRPGGRLVVVSFHSLEDRIVKRFLQERAGRRPGGSRHAPAVAAPEPAFRILTRQPVTPGEKETESNPRARSARLRAAVRTTAPAGEADPAALGLPDLPDHDGEHAR